MAVIDFQSEAQALQPELVARRRDLHQHPELSFQEYRTAGIVAEELQRLGMEVQTGIGKTGVVAILEGPHDGPTVLLRADMDALPITEANSVPYASTVEGVMHACGHDAHTTIGLGVAQILSRHRDRIHGRVKFVFQPAEEIGGGAKAMVRDGVLRDPKPDVTLGLHVWNSEALGNVVLLAGPTMAGSSDFRILIQGSGGHAAMPQVTADPIVCGAMVVNAIQTLMSRNSDPLEPSVISVTRFHAGTANNIIPSEAELSGTFRTYSPATRSFYEEKLKSMVAGIAEAMGCRAEIEVRHFTLPVINDGEVTEQVKAAVSKAYPELRLVEARTMGAEDVSELMTDVPGCYFFVGSANHERDLSFPHHHPRFDIDEDVLALGVGLLATAVASYLLPSDAEA
jgi:amidohydrolase